MLHNLMMLCYSSGVLSARTPERCPSPAFAFLTMINQDRSSRDKLKHWMRAQDRAELLAKQKTIEQACAALGITRKSLIAFAKRREIDISHIYRPILRSHPSRYSHNGKIDYALVQSVANGMHTIKEVAAATGFHKDTLSRAKIKPGLTPKSKEAFASACATCSTVEEVADYLGCSVRSVYRASRKHGIPAPVSRIRRDSNPRKMKRRQSRKTSALRA